MNDGKNIILEKSIEFSLSIIELYKALQQSNEFVISKQLLRSATSVGANLHEAISASSKTDFIHKNTLSLKEAREAQYWLVLLDKSQLVQTDYSKYLSDIDEIIRILVSILKTSK